MKCEGHLVTALHLENVPDHKTENETPFVLPEAVTILGGNALCLECVINYFDRQRGGKPSLILSGVLDALMRQLAIESTLD